MRERNELRAHVPWARGQGLFWRTGQGRAGPNKEPAPLAKTMLPKLGQPLPPRVGHRHEFCEGRIPPPRTRDRGAAKRNRDTDRDAVGPRGGWKCPPRGGARLGAALLRPIGRIRGCADPRPLRRGLLRALLSLAVHQVARAGGFAALGAPAGLAPSPRPAVLLLPVRETLIALRMAQGREPRRGTAQRGETRRGRSSTSRETAAPRPSSNSPEPNPLVPSVLETRVGLRLSSRPARDRGEPPT